jgi:hypothetical protein
VRNIPFGAPNDIRVRHLARHEHKRNVTRRAFFFGTLAALALLGPESAQARFKLAGGNIGFQLPTIARTVVSYQTIPLAIQAAQSGDVLLIPSGLFAPGNTSLPYAHITQNTDLNAARDGYNNFWITKSLTFTGTGTANNGRARLQMPYCRLASNVTTANIPTDAGATITASISGTTANVTALLTGFSISPGQTFTDTTGHLAANTTILNQLTGPTGGIGTYTVSISQTVTSETMTAASAVNWAVDSVALLPAICPIGLNVWGENNPNITGGTTGITPGYYPPAFCWSGIDAVNNLLLGVYFATGGGESPSYSIPSGTLLTMCVLNNQSLFTSLAPNPGLIFNNIEFAGACTGGGTADACAVKMGPTNLFIGSITGTVLTYVTGCSGAYPANGQALVDPSGLILPGTTVVNQVGSGNTFTVSQSQNVPAVLMQSGPALGSLTMNYCLVRNCNSGIVGNLQLYGSGIFAHFYETEFYQNGCTYNTHNLYINGIDELIFWNCYSHWTTGVHLLKTRARSNIIAYSRITGEQTVTLIDPNTGEDDESCNIDVSNGGLTNIIGCQFEQSVPATNVCIDYNAEGSSNTTYYGTTVGPGAANPIQELNFINNTVVLNAISQSYRYVDIRNCIGVGNPEELTLSYVSGGSLGSQTCSCVATCTTSAGGETLPGTAVSLVVPASNLLVVTSPVARTGANGWNLYVNGTKQNASPIAIGTSWTEPTSGLTGSGAAPPGTSTATTGSPVLLVQNNLSEYALIDSTHNGIVWPTTGGVVTLTSNVSASYSAGPSAGPPYITPPTADFVDEATYDYHLSSGSSAIGVGTDPGVSLRPLWQISYSGTPTPGTPIPPLTARPSYTDAGAFAYGTGS